MRGMADTRAHTIHTRPIMAEEDRVRVEVQEPSRRRSGSRDDGDDLANHTQGQTVYTEILLPEQRFVPPPWVVWGIRYKGWQVLRYPLADPNGGRE